MDEVVKDTLWWYNTHQGSVEIINATMAIENKTEEDLDIIKRNVLHLDYLLTRFDFESEGLDITDIVNTINSAKRVY